MGDSITGGCEIYFAREGNARVWPVDCPVGNFYTGDLSFFRAWERGACEWCVVESCCKPCGWCNDSNGGLPEKKKETCENGSEGEQGKTAVT